MAKKWNLGPWCEEVTNDAIEFLKDRGKFPGSCTRGADGQGIDFKTGIDFLIGLWNSLTLKLQVKYAEGKKPFRSLSKHLRHYPAVRYILLFSDRLEDDLVKWKEQQKAPELKDKFGRNIPEGIHIALVHMDEEIHDLAAREQLAIRANPRYRMLRAEHARYQCCRGQKSRMLPEALWRHLANVEEEMREIVQRTRMPFRADPHYQAFVERVAANLEKFVEAACVTALDYERAEEARRNAKRP